MVNRRPRHQILLALGLLALTSASSLGASDSTALVDRYLEAWNSHDVEAAETLLDEDFSYFNSSIGERTGKQSITHVIQNLATLMPDMHLRLIAPPVKTGNAVAFEWQFTGTAMQQQNRRPVSLRGASFMRIEAGKLVHLSDYYNAQSMSEQLAP